MNLRSWEYFVAVAEECHFGRAAARLHIAQPPLSRQVRTLEAELGVALLHRTNRRVSLTPAGAVFLSGARRVLKEAAVAVREARDAEHGTVGRLRIGFIASASHGVVPRLLQAYRARYPNVDLELVVGTSLEQFAMLRADRLDIGLVREAGGVDGLSVHAVQDEPLSVLLPPGDRLAQSPCLSIGDLADRPLILYPRADNPAIYDRVVGYCRGAGFEPRIVQEASEAVIAGLVGAGLGTALVIGSHHPLSPGGATSHRLVPPAPTWRLVLAWKQTSPLIANLLGVAESGTPPN